MLSSGKRLLGSFAVLVSLAGAAHAEPTVFAERAKVYRVAGVEISKDQLPHYRKFARACAYFGAFAVNTDGKISFWVNCTNSRQAAVAGALEGCRQTSAENNANPNACALYAVSLPVGADSQDTSLSGLGSQARQHYLQSYKKKQTKTGHGAFAISQGLGSGSAWGWKNQAEAEATALAHCHAEVAQMMGNLGIAGREWIKRNGYDRCRIVDTYAPPK